MTYVRCASGACPTRWDCDFNRRCLNTLVTAQERINIAFTQYELMREANATARANDPKFEQPVTQKPLDVKPICWHTEKSEFGICLKCGHWS